MDNKKDFSIDRYGVFEDVTGYWDFQQRPELGTFETKEEALKACPKTENCRYLPFKVEKTTVVFRKFEGFDLGFGKSRDEVIALFPFLKANKHGDCESYMHIGQHSAADYSGVIDNTTPANISEYAPLAKELEMRGYSLDIKQKRPKRSKS